jgi:hypothetical protein
MALVTRNGRQTIKTSDDRSIRSLVQCARGIDRIIIDPDVSILGHVRFFYCLPAVSSKTCRKKGVRGVGVGEVLDMCRQTVPSGTTAATACMQQYFHSGIGDRKLISLDRSLDLCTCYIFYAHQFLLRRYCFPLQVPMAV